MIPHDFSHDLVDLVATLHDCRISTYFNHCQPAISIRFYHQELLTLWVPVVFSDFGKIPLVSPLVVSRCWFLVQISCDSDLEPGSPTNSVAPRAASPRAKVGTSGDPFGGAMFLSLKSDRLMTYEQLQETLRFMFHFCSCF